MGIHFHKFKALLHAASILSAGIILLSGCSAIPQNGGTSTQSLASITDTPTHRYHPGKFVWHDLLSTDVNASQDFYGKLFGWRFSSTGGYVEIYNGKHKIGGIVRIEKGQNEQTITASWLASISVANVDAAIDQVRAHKGKVINGPLNMPLRGKGALVADSRGAHLVLLHAKDGDPEDREPAMGDWLWNEIWSNAPEETIAFYKAVGGYSEIKKEGDYAIFINEDKWRAGVRFSDHDVSIRWVPAIRVSDPGSLLEKVEELGGNIWIRPGDLPGNPDTALISDNMGALLILQRWTFSNLRERH